MRFLRRLRSIAARTLSRIDREHVTLALVAVLILQIAMALAVILVTSVARHPSGCRGGQRVTITRSFPNGTIVEDRCVTSD